MSDDQLPLEPSPEVAILHALDLISPQDRVLDAGCFRGDDAVFAATAGCRVTGVDMSAGAIAYARRVAAAFGVGDRARFVRGQLPETLGRFPEASFDVVMDRLLLSNLDGCSAKTYLAEIARVLRPGGLFLLRYGAESRTPLHAMTARPPRGLRAAGFLPFRWRSDDDGDVRRSRPVRIVLHPHRFGFAREAVLLLLTRASSRLTTRKPRT